MFQIPILLKAVSCRVASVLNGKQQHPAVQQGGGVVFVQGHNGVVYCRRQEESVIVGRVLQEVGWAGSGQERLV